MNWNEAIEYALLVRAAYAVLPGSLADQAGLRLDAGGRPYTVVASIYANDLATDISLARGEAVVSIGLVCQAVGGGDVVVALRGTEGIMEWVHDAEFALVPCPFLASAGHTEDGFTAMYESLRLGVAPGSPGVARALASLPYPNRPTSMTICGHSLGGALATLLALDVAANTPFRDVAAYTYASPHVGGATFARAFNQAVPRSFRVANRLDLVPKLPFPPLYEHVLAINDLNPVHLFPPPFRILVRAELACAHSLTTYLHLMSRVAGGAVLPLDATCMP